MKPIIIRPHNDGVFFRGKRIEGNYHLPYYLRGGDIQSKILPANRKHLIKTWQVLHINACHSTYAFEKKWKAAYRRFEKHHLPKAFGRISNRFISNHTAHAWL